jgi:uncharacterized protein
MIGLNCESTNKCSFKRKLRFASFAPHSLVVRLINIQLAHNRKGDKMAVNYNFEWDPIKARENWNKHNVAFDEAATIFRDLEALSIFDPDHSETEDRWITMGISEKGRLLIVSHTYREEGGEGVTIRIFSSRKATKKETKKYGD